MSKTKKILLLLLLAATMAIILFPSNKKPDLDGDWSIDEIVINGKRKPFQGGCGFYGDRLDVTGEGEFFANQVLERATVNITKDSLKIISEKEDSFYTGKYRISLSKEILNTHKRNQFLGTLKLTSANKVVTMHRYEDVNWNKGIPKGRP